MPRPVAPAVWRAAAERGRARARAHRFRPPRAAQAAMQAGCALIADVSRPPRGRACTAPGDAARRAARSGRPRPAGRGSGPAASAKRGRQQHVLVERAAHGGDPAGLVDRGADHGEVEPVVAADVAVEHLADVQAEIEARDRQAVGRAPLVQGADAADRVAGGVERAGGRRRAAPRRRRSRGCRRP